MTRKRTSASAAATTEKGAPAIKRFAPVPHLFASSPERVSWASEQLRAAKESGKQITEVFLSQSETIMQTNKKFSASVQWVTTTKEEGKAT